jgi:ELWxxDGT repeat protein
MVKDIYLGGGDAYPALFAVMNGTLFFSAIDGTHGSELWASDGTEAGTIMVKDANPGTAPGLHYLLASINGTLFLVATEGVHGLELWASDGTEAGTTMIKDIKPGGAGSFGTFTSWPENFIAASGTLFFTTTDDVHGNELWASDGTPEGTTLVKDIHPSDSSSPRNLTNFGDALFFAADDGSHGDELWTLTVQDLRLSKSVTPTVGVAYHGPITYTLALRNAAWGTESAAQLVDALPGEVDFGGWVEQPGGATVADNEICWNGTVSAGGTITLTFTALHTGSYSDVATNTAHFTGNARAGSTGALFTVVNRTPISKVYIPIIYKFD